jgi:hypothetical protein
MESLDRPYGDDEQDYTTVNPEPEPSTSPPPQTRDFTERETEMAAEEARRIGRFENPQEPPPPGGTDPDKGYDPPSWDEDARRPDPAWVPLQQAGEGLSEGFEVAEGQLIDNIAGAPDADRTPDGFDLADPGTDVDEDVAGDVQKTLDDFEPSDAPAVPADEEARKASGRYGEADEEDITEVVRDPNEGPDDPGAGPGVAFDR